MIEKIEMRNCASYDETGVELSDCSKINFIYGPNGSGKSTISNFFRNYSVTLRNPQILHKVEKRKGSEKNQRNVNIQEAKKVVC